MNFELYRMKFYCNAEIQSDSHRLNLRNLEVGSRSKKRMMRSISVVHIFHELAKRKT